MEEHTFVIPVYKESPYLEACIKSLIGQTVKSKIVIATSTPTTFSKNIAAKYNIPYYVNNSGQTSIATDWNFALANANTKLVTITHQDDIYEPTYAEEVSRVISSNCRKQIQIAFTNYTDLVNGQIRKTSLNAFVKQSLLWPFAFNNAISNYFFKKLVLRFGDPICCPSVTLNMEVLSGFSFPADYQCALDWFAWYQLALQPGAFVYINKKLMQHRIHPGSETTNQLMNGIRQQEELRLFELMWGKRMAKLIAKLYTLGHKDNLM